MALTLAGCQREAVTSYTIPKEDYSVRTAAASSDPHAEESARPHVHWDLPSGWEERKGEGMSVGRFRIAEGEKSAEVSIVPMPGADRVPDLEAQSVEMWKSNLGAEGTTNLATKVEIAGAEGRLYDITGDKGRLTAGVVNLSGTLWFVRMSGDSGVVAKQQDAFRGFLKSLSIHEEDHDAPAAVEAKWPGAEGWTAVAPGSMVLAAYSVNGKANVTVTSFPGDVGGMLANVNRWRGQIGLGPISEGELSNFTKSITLSDGTKATAVELKSDSKVSYTIVAMRAGQSWFYKILGDAETVNAEKDRLAEFAGRAK